MFLLTNLLKDLPKNFDKFTSTNVESFQIAHNGDIIFICGQEEIESLKGDIKINEKEIEKLEKEKEKLDDELEEALGKLEEVNKTLSSYQISPTDTIKELVERNEWQEGQLIHYKGLVQKFIQANREFDIELKNARSRKNKATVKRCINTGKLIAVFQDAEYEMVKK